MRPTDWEVRKRPGAEFSVAILFEFSHNLQSWQYWYLIQMYWTTFKELKGILFCTKILRYVFKRFHFCPKSLMYIFIRIFSILWILFDVIELDANVANFVYYGKTRICQQELWYVVTMQSSLFDKSIRGDRNDRSSVRWAVNYYHIMFHM